MVEFEKSFISWAKWWFTCIEYGGAIDTGAGSEHFFGSVEYYCAFVSARNIFRRVEQRFQGDGRRISYSMSYIQLYLCNKASSII